MRDGPPRWGAGAWLAAALEGVLDLVLPGVCAGCGRPIGLGESDGSGGPAGRREGTARHSDRAGAGSRSLCGACRGTLTWPDGRGPRVVAVSTPGLPAVWAAGPYDGPLRRLIVAYKDGDRRDARSALAPMFADSIVAAARSAGGVAAVVPVPSSAASRRRRGDEPLRDLVRAALETLGPDPAHVGLMAAPLLRVTRRVRDQAGLDAAARAANLAGSFTVRPVRTGRAVPPGLPCLLVDDVVTTGSSLAEAVRALRAAGARPIACAVVAATPRRIPGPRRGRGNTEAA